MIPSYAGRGLGNLIAELERRLTGTSPSPGLTPELADQLPAAATYVVVLFDGLGNRQLTEADTPANLIESRRGVLDAPFPSTTTVSLGTVVTALEPRAHGILGHLMWIPELEEVVNTLKWVTPAGRSVIYPTESLLPHPNLWERLTAAGIEAITVQPGDFATTPLTRALYRGARFEPFWGIEEVVDATVTLAREPRRLILTYLPQVDYAAHVWGQRSSAYQEAVALVAAVWDRIGARLPEHVVLVGTADHGLIDYPETGKHLIRDTAYDRLRFFGDPRALLVSGDFDTIGQLAEETGAEMLSGEGAAAMWGDGETEHPSFGERRPDAVLLAPTGKLLLPRGFDKRLVGYHGGLEPKEREIPLLVG